MGSSPPKHPQNPLGHHRSIVNSITIHARAKINLTLEVLGKRDDGFHEIASIIQTVDLHDTLTLKHDETISMRCNSKELDTSSNLVMEAAHLIKSRTNSTKGARIVLHKNIPVSAGLGGGSSDAAATLIGLNNLWGTGLDTDELVNISSELGSDVPFFIHGGTALTLGRGERVRPLPPPKPKWIVLLCPSISFENKTKALFGMLSESDFTRGDLTRKLGARIWGGGDIPPQFLFNTFDEVAMGGFKELQTYKDAFHSLGAREIHVAGAGPSLYAYVPNKKRGSAIQLMLHHSRGWQAFLVSTWSPSPRDSS